MEIKKHYKMFKSGKKWAFASIATASLGLVALNTNAEKAHADSDAQANTNSASQLDQQTKTAPVNEKQVTLAKPATVKASSAAVTAQSAAPASSAAQSAAKVNADSTAKADQHSAAAKVETKATTSSAVKPAKEAASANAVKAAPASSAAKKVSTSVASSAAPSSAASKMVTSAAVKDSAAKEAVSSAANVKSSSAAAKTSVNSSAVSEAAQKDAKAEKTAEKKTDNSSKDYTIDNTYRLADNEGSDQKTNNKIIVAHAVGQYSSARDVAIYEKREWDSSETYVQYIVGDGGRVYAVGEEGYVAWGAGKWANENAPVQVELAQTYSDSQFKKDYQTYVNLLRDSAKKWNIPTTLDSDEYTGIKSHVWVTEHVWGNHVDPYGYLGTHGITKEQFAHDLAYGFGNDAANDNQNNNQNDNHQNDNQNNQNNNHQNDSSNNHGNQNNQSYHVGDKVTIKNSASHWATGQSIYNGVKGHTYKIIQTNGHKLLLDQVISWINDGDVYKAGSNSGSSNNHNNNHTTNNADIKVGTVVTINNNASHWATGQSIYSGVKGKSYKVIQTNGNRLLLDKVISWINKGDVHVPGSNSNNNNSGNQNHNNGNNHNNNGNTESIHVGSKVTINNNAKRWATGQNIYSGVKGKTYTVIQMNGSRLLLDKVISWINKGDVHLPGSNGSQNNNNNNNNHANNNDGTIRVGTNVTIKPSAKRWATGQNIYYGVKGKTYKVIQMNGNRLLLDKVISWINKGDVYVPGSSNNNNSNSNNNHNNNGSNYHFTNQNWTAAQTNFVNSIASDVMNVCQNNHLYASVAMAQAVVESAYGASTLAQEAHNLFGIKADSTWHGATYTKNTQEVINGRVVTISAAFRKYDSFKDSIADYAKKLESRPQYANAFSNHAHNYVESVKAIKAGGYATAPTYVSSIVNCINNYGFYKLDGLDSAISL